MKQKRLNKYINSNSVIITMVSVSITSVAGAATISPIAATGWNYDVVYEVGATGSGNGKFTNEDTALFETGLATMPFGSGIPSSGLITSELDGTQFQFQSYTSNNALLFGEGSGLNKFETLDVTDGVYSNFSFLGLGAGGPSNFSFVLFFTDGTNTSNGNPDFEGSGHFARGVYDGQTFDDWFSLNPSASNGTAGIAATNAGRVSSNDGSSAGGGLSIQQFNYNYATVAGGIYAGKTLDRIEFESTGGGGNNRTVFAFSAESVPEPTSALSALLGSGLLLLRRKRA